MWVRLITSQSCRYVSKNGSVNGRCFPELWPAHSLAHTPLALKRFFHHHHHHHHHHHLTVALENTAITLPLSLSVSSPTYFVLSGTLLKVCWCTNSQCALSFSSHIYTRSSLITLSALFFLFSPTHSTGLHRFIKLCTWSFTSYFPPLFSHHLFSG